MKLKSSTVKYLIILGVILIAGILIGVFFYKDIAEFLSRLFSGEITQESAREFMQSFGWRGAIIIAVLSCLQIVLTVLPAEPVQVVAGMSYGIFLGVGILMIGVVVGNIIMFVLSRTAGAKLTKYFHSKVHIDFNSSSASAKVTWIIFLLYFLPAIPYGLICFMAASTGMKFYKYIIMTTIGSIPSVFIGAGLGAIAIESSWIITLVTVIVLVILMIIVFCMRNKIFDAINRKLDASKLPHSTKTIVKKPNGFVYGLANFLVSIFLKFKVKIRFSGLNRKQRKQLKGCVVISNHPSFVDWVYAGMAMLPLKCNFIVARYYFYHRKLSKIIKSVGGFPKSMFTADLESARNLMRVRNQGGTLCLLPEARLSTVGKTESIQPVTAKMLKILKSDIVVVNVRGSYLAKPKWGKGFRKGSLIEVNVSKWLDKEQLAQMTEAEVFEGLQSVIDYNDFDWLEAHPELNYAKTQNLAEGLENILCRCPSCDGISTFVTDKRTITCSKCGYSATLDDRYGFVYNSKEDVTPANLNSVQGDVTPANTNNIQEDISATPDSIQGSNTAIPDNSQLNNTPKFKNLQDWYGWIEDKYREEIDDNYELRDKVKLKLPSLDGKRCFRLVGEGECVLNKQGLTYEGTVDGESSTIHIDMKDIYRLLFGAGEDFEIYHEKNFYYFMPEDLRRCVIWYIVSGIMNDKYNGEAK